ncbi:tRNA-specific adenosine deaminase 1 [Rhizopus azygosporus]|uniref:tRNA-specific adenosine deaminase 1 n=1 Tax=Rhizopus azygosporus TaxID=86630 RepID=A0A367JD50_RHIAZ|nr:tRNA-specific adenosine deaminase 1 [Rhizopus azygosporus]
MSWKHDPDAIVNATLKKYKELPKQGKPIFHETKAEWTVLASIVMVHDLSIDRGHFIRYSTGLKCLPFSKLSKAGDTLHDSHAEVIARRGFIKFLLEYAKSFDPSHQDSPFYKKDGKLALRPEYSFHMYISQSPCGDASMTALAAQQTSESFEQFQSGSNKRKRMVEYLTENMYINKKQKISTQQFRRGRFEYDQLGVLRTKPGRVDSEPTLCMSCSDKLARWNVLGIQSALLTFLFHPIYLSSVTIGDMYDHEAIKRALCQRLSSLEGLPSSYRLNCPIIAKTDIPFEASKSVLEKRYASTIPSSTSILWVKGMAKSEVFVNGQKQGAPKGKPTTAKTRPSICKLNMFHEFLTIRQKEEKEEKEGQNYSEWKQGAIEYQKAKTCLLDQVFQSWVQTPLEYEQFK